MATAIGLDQLGNLLTSFGPIGTGLALAAVPVVTGVAVYVTRMGSQAKIDALEGEIKRLEAKKEDDLARAQEKYADDLVRAQEKHSELEARYQAILRSGALIQAQLDAIVLDVSEIAARLDAADYSVLVPAPTSIPGDTPDQLVFLCVSGPQSSKLRWVRVPISSSLSGAVYLSGKATIASPPASGNAFASRTDKIIDYKTRETLSVCLRYRGQHVGVAQFVNKRAGKFDSTDTERALNLCTSLAIRVGDFVSDPRGIIEMGHAPRSNKTKVSVMFVDITNFAVLFERLDASVITDLLNQYFQELCAIALRHGATVDQYIGDGVLLIFNIDQNQKQHETAALKAAEEMRSAFRNLKQRWITLGYDGTDVLFVRFGLSSGEVTRAEIGHAHARRVTVIGPPVNAAAYACEGGPRSHDTICITHEMRDALAIDIKTSKEPINTKRATVFEVLE